MSLTPQMKALSQELGTVPVATIDQVTHKPYKSKAYGEALYARKECLVLENGDILLSDCTPAGLRLAKAIADLVYKEGLATQIRASTRDVVKHIRSQSDSTPNEQTKTKDNIVTIVSSDDNSYRAEDRLKGLVVDAVNRGASDIHIVSDTKNKTATVEYRIHGQLEVQDRPAFRMTAEDATAIGAYIASYKSQEDNTGGEEFDSNVPIDSACVVNTETLEQKLRYSHLPLSSPSGISIALRLLSASTDGHIPSFRELGFSKTEEALLLRAFRYPEGIVLFTGPTGSGKSTTMSSGVSTLPPSVKKISIEDPVENHLPGVCQVQINTKNEKTTFANYSKMMVRHDPDVIIYGEIRDPVVLKESVAQANTGHLIIATLHANGAAKAPARLIELGMSFQEAASDGLIRTICASRLTPRLCHGCAIPLSEAIVEPWATDDHRRIFNHFKDLAQLNKGDIHKVLTTNHVAMSSCDICGGKGTTGRAPLIEIINVDTRGRQFIKEGDIIGWVAYMKSKGWKTMTDKAVDKIFKGDADPLKLDSVVEMPFGLDGDEFDYNKFDEDVIRVEKMKFDEKATIAKVSGGDR